MRTLGRCLLWSLGLLLIAIGTIETFDVITALTFSYTASGEPDIRTFTELRFLGITFPGWAAYVVGPLSIVIGLGACFVGRRLRLTSR